MSFIDEDLYGNIIRNVPILCIDLIIFYKNQFLLVKRKQNPLINEWWVPGGRVKHGESLDEAAIRKLNEELAIKEFSGLRKHGLYQDKFDESSFGKHLYQTFSVVYKLKIKNIFNINVDNTSDDWALKNKLPQRLINKMEIINE